MLNEYDRKILLDYYLINNFFYYFSFSLFHEGYFNVISFVVDKQGNSNACYFVVVSRTYLLKTMSIFVLFALHFYLYHLYTYLVAF